MSQENKKLLKSMSDWQDWFISFDRRYISLYSAPPIQYPCVIQWHDVREPDGPMSYGGKLRYLSIVYLSDFEA